MYSYINGEITEINPTSITIEANNIGYCINVASPYSFSIGEIQKIYLYQKVSEDDISLYGFSQLEQKKIFEDLISVKGIGPKTAILILAATSILEFENAVMEKNITYLMKFPKIGKKSAQQIILDLENKYATDESLVPTTTSNEVEVIEALLSLGYDLKNIKKVIIQLDNSMSLEEKIKYSLKLLMKL